MSLDHNQIVERLRTNDWDGLPESQIGALKQLSEILVSLNVTPMNLDTRSVILLNHEQVILGAYLSHLIMAFEDPGKTGMQDMREDAPLAIEHFFARELKSGPRVARLIPGIVQTLVDE